MEIVDPVAHISLSGRTAEISLGGCYMDVLNTLPKDTVVQLTISRDLGSFHSWGRIAYVHQGIGMGVQFLDTDLEQKRILKHWVDELDASGFASL